MVQVYISNGFWNFIGKRYWKKASGFDMNFAYLGEIKGLFCEMTIKTDLKNIKGKNKAD